MTVRLSQTVAPPDHVGLKPYAEAPAQPLGAPPASFESEGVPWGRYIEVLKRHALLIVAVAFVGCALGYLFARRIRGVYEAQTTVWITPPVSAEAGPIRIQQLLPQPSWVELLRSYAIVDPVVRKLHLNVTPAVPADSVLFRNFESLPGMKPGGYTLRIAGENYSLRTAKNITVEKGVLGDSIGRVAGFGWAPARSLLAGRREIAFSVVTPRTASLSLISHLHTTLPDDGQFLKISLSGTDPVLTARSVNAWTEQFVASSGDLKKRHLLEFKKILGDQLNTAESELRSSEMQLERFRVQTITLPSEGAPVASGGLRATRDPVISNYFEQKQTLSEVRAERVALEQLLAKASREPLDPEAFLMLPAILANAPQLSAAITDYSSKQATLRSEQQFLTDANPRIKQQRDAIRFIQTTTIPQIAQGILQRLKDREQSMSAEVDTQSRELRAIPSRTIEEMRLTRQVAVSENLYSMLKARYEEVSLAEAQTIPDLSILDIAGVPTGPSSNDGPRLFLMAVLGSIGVAVGVALLHDRLDRRFRYPEQATRELGLTIAGTVPRFRPKRGGEFQVETMSQAIESFRTLRLALQYEFSPSEAFTLSISSPSGGDGKSLVSANLALAFAGAGYRTLLIDGDVRRGSLHSTFDLAVTPGLVEYLTGDVTLDAVIRSTSAENLFIVPRGKRGGKASELLISDEMRRLVLAANEKFDVIIVDSPPFIAGVDAYALGAATGNLLMVLRQGVSDRKLAAAKLAIVDRLPIRLLGVVINGVPAGGMYKYYGTGYGPGGLPAKDYIGNVATPGGVVVQA